ncbi:MAG: SulP family inorganic anion transporter [Gemmatimonadetes bacterium]|nr:SulP family inorganic anion transporter [Gemmatimonadota bacterium]MBM4190701.1 SulP family inorganic anion transporter [Gemmatimonadota bacterium]
MTTHSQQIDWKADAPASIVVFLVALPLCLGIALASGAPLFAGVIAGVVGGLIVAPISGSALMVSGPAAGLTAIVLAAITQLGDYRAFLVAVVIGGVLQILFAAVRAGIIGYYFPSSVIKGMLSSIGIVLILKQVPHAIGYDASAMGGESFAEGEATTFSAVADALGAIQPGAALIAAISLVLLFAWPRTPLAKVKLLPAPLAVVLLGLAANALYPTLAPGWTIDATHLVALPIPTSGAEWAQQFATPAWGAITSPAVWRIAVTLGIVASLETLLSLEATDKMDPYKREAPPNRELLAQGVGNTLSGLIGGLPLTGVIVRSAANVSAGAKTRWSAILHAVLLAGAVVAIPQLLNRIPLAALAAILLHTGWKLAHPSIGRALWAQGRSQFIPYAITILVVLVTDLLVGIGVGMAVGIFFLLRDMLKAPPFTEVSPKGAVLRRFELHPYVNFLNKGALLSVLDDLPDGASVEIDGRQVQRIDPDVLEVIHNFRETAMIRGIDYQLVGVPALSTGGNVH